MVFHRTLMCCGTLIALTSTVCVAQFGIGSGLRADGPARTVKDLRDQNVVKQRFDFSCGAAALATLLRFGFNEPITERNVLEELFGLLSDDEKVTVRREGFSLLHLQRVAQKRGFAAQGFRLTAEQLTMLGGPVIVFIQPRGYKHFAVLRGVRGDRAYLADPARGNLRMPAQTFLHDWLQDDRRGIIFVVEPLSGVPQTPMPLTLGNGSSLPERLTIQELMGAGVTPVRLPEGFSR